MSTESSSSAPDFMALLASRPDGHAVELLEVRLHGRSAEVQLSTVPWWSGSSDAAPVSLNVRIEDVLDVRVGEASVPLGPFTLAEDHPLLWDYGPWSTIFGTAPLPDPPRFFFEFYQLVQSELSVARDPALYLNWNDSLKEWTGFVYSRAYCLLTAPATIASAATALLDVQAAEYSLLPNAENPRAITQHQSGTPKLLTLGNSWIAFTGTINTSVVTP